MKLNWHLEAIQLCMDKAREGCMHYTLQNGCLLCEFTEPWGAWGVSSDTCGTTGDRGRDIRPSLTPYPITDHLLDNFILHHSDVMQLETIIHVRGGVYMYSTCTS